MGKSSRHTDILNRLDDYSQSAATALTTGQRARKVAQKMTGVSLAAGAAGLTLSGGGPVEAVVVHSSVNQAFGTVAGALSLTMEGTQREAGLRGRNDSYGSSLRWAGVNAYNGVVTTGGIRRIVQSLPTSQYVGPATNTVRGQIGNFTHNSISGVWVDNQPHYFGFTFRVEGSGQLVYGWGQLQRTSPGNGILIEWAYEDSGAPLQVGDTVGIPEANALALFALGAAGVLAYRKRKKKAE